MKDIAVVKISVGHQPMKQADENTYPGTLITKDGSCGENTRRRIEMSE